MRFETLRSCATALLLGGVLALLSLPLAAQTPSETSPSATPPAVPSQDSVAPPAPGAGTTPESGTAPGITSDAVTQTLEVPARPVAFMRGAASWDDGYKTIRANLAKIATEVDKAGLKQGGHPIAVFVDTDENGFKFEAMLPLDTLPEGKTQLTDEVKLGSSPAGKALKFQHRGAYDDIDSTYDLITAFLDEKGLEAQNLFIEEYLNDVAGADDPSLQVDIYVFIK
jgi:effector-binding domain-containing protein